MNDPIDKADENRSWENGDKPEDFDGMKDALPENWGDWVVKLEFIKDGAKNWGTGFYINLDSSKYSTILTAAHNLISESKQPVKDLKILQAAPQSNVPIPNSSIRICESYKTNPSRKNRVSDYGAILRPLDPNQRGFGFAIKLGLIDEIPTSVYVTGHSQQPDGEPPVAKTNSGNIKLVRPNYLRHDVKAITGNSGGPLWLPYRGFETAIGIHNYGIGSLKDPNALSQATRLSFDVYRDICQWAELGWSSKSLKVSQNKAPALGLYLRFSKDVPFGRVRLGPEELDTRFDIIPGLTNSGLLDKPSTEFVFLFKEPVSWRDDEDGDSENDDGNTSTGATRGKGQANVAAMPLLVRWKADPHRPQVSLSSTFHDECLVQLNPKLNAYEIIRDYGEDKWKLRMQMNEIEMPASREDREGFWSLFESSEVGFVRSREKTSKFPFTLFAFE